MLEHDYLKNKRQKLLFIAFTILVTLGLAFLFTTIGMRTGFDQTFVALERFCSGTINEGQDAALNKIILLLRFPRLIMALIAGAGLAVAGVVMQAVTRNYLVSPFTLGISSAAAFGASVAIVFATGAFFQSDLGIVLAAFCSACICGLIVYGISCQIGIKPSSIVLIGIALNYFFSAMTATIEFFAQENKLAAVVQWTFGSFNRANWDNVVVAALIVAFGSVFIWCYSLKLNAIAANDDEMLTSLGIDPEQLRTLGGLVAIVLTATIISFTGVIGFVGLIAPHMARLIIGGDHRYYIPFAAVLGALLLLVSDTVGRFILYPVNIPVGIIVSFLGVPLFVHLIMLKGKEMD